MLAQLRTCLAVMAVVATAAAQKLQSISPPPTAGGACALTSNNHIYCFGGTQNPTNSQSMINNLIMLDVSNFDYSDMSFQWQNVIPNSYTFQANMIIQMVAINKGSSIFIQEPTNTYNHAGNVPPFISGNPTADQYTNIQLQSNASFPGTYTSRISPAIVDLSSIGQNQVWIWGGRSETALAGGLVASNFVLLYDYTQNQFSMIKADTPNNMTRYGHTATLTNDGTGIVMLGGIRAVPNSNQTVTNNTYLNTVWVFNTTTSTWSASQPNSTSMTLPSDRAFHTTTLIPGTDYMMVYGGMATNLQNYLVNDPSYLYNAATNSFITVTIGLGNIGPGLLCQHSAVFVHDNGTSSDLIYYIFGAGESMKATNKVSVLNVTNPNRMQWVASSNGGAPSDSGSTNLSGGAIAGIAVGCIVGGIAIAGAIVFYVLRKRKQKQDFYLEDTDPRQQIPIDGELSTTEDTTLSAGRHLVEMDPIKPSTDFDEARFIKPTINSSQDDPATRTKPFGES
ncbi:hypothetical protein BC940DRAFT_35984 [Gongronella butleri]|nr:hypothetical protein BC940DRAFT_35984 [Gongronella butleri]